MIIPSYILTFCVLMLILWQDSKYRAIHWTLLLLLSVGIIGISTNLISVKELLNHFLMNLGFVALQGLGITLYLSIKKKKVTNPINTAIGIGDILFLLVICLAFSFLNFIFFITLGCVAMIFVYFALQAIGKKPKTVPMAGWLSIGLMVVYIMQLLHPTLTTYTVITSKI